MQEAISAYRARLDKALVAHQPISDMNDVDEIVVEKKNLLAFDEKAMDTFGAAKVSYTILFAGYGVGKS